jgi:hypothetical protein
VVKVNAATKATKIDSANTGSVIFMAGSLTQDESLVREVFSPQPHESRRRPVQPGRTEAGLEDLPAADRLALLYK